MDVDASLPGGKNRDGVEMMPNLRCKIPFRALQKEAKILVEVAMEQEETVLAISAALSYLRPLRGPV